MPFADNQGVRIYYQVEGKGPPLVLLHGFGMTHWVWYQGGYVDGLKDEYRLILVDGRGCGQSDKPHDTAAYALPSLVGDIVAVLDDLDVERASYFGVSWGGYVGRGIARYVPQRFRSLIFCGDGPSEDRFDPERDQALQVSRAGREVAVPVLREWFGQWWTSEWECYYAEADYDALVASRLAIANLDVNEVVASLTMPCLFLIGESDPGYPSIKACCERVPIATFVSLPGLDHFGAFLYGDRSLPHVRRFLAQVASQE